MGFFRDGTSPEKGAFGFAALPDRSEHAIAENWQTELRQRMRVLVLKDCMGALPAFDSCEAVYSGMLLVRTLVNLTLALHMSEALALSIQEEASAGPSRIHPFKVE